MSSGQNLFGYGFGVALITPFSSTNKVDEESLVQVVQHVVQGGADFLVALGSTGEAAMLDDHERQHVIELVAGHRGNTKLIIGTGTSATRSTCARTKKAQDDGADAALVAVPSYTKPTQAGIIAHFTAIASAVPGLPIIAYNVPSRTGVNLAPETMRELWRIPTVVALKESSGNIQQISRIAAELPAGKTLLAGDDGLLLPTIAGGGHGIVSVAGNVVPQAIRELLVAAKSSDLKSARRQLTALQPLFDALSLEPNPTSIKAAVALMGMASATPRLPLLPATEATRNAIRTALQQTRSLSTHV